MIYIPGRTEAEQHRVRFHHPAQDSVQFKIQELFTPGISDLILSGCD